MARIRTIKPEFFRHEELYQLEKETKLPIRIAFAGLWIVCDREGRFKWRPNQLKLDVLPFDDLDFSRVLHALWTRGFVVKYACNSEVYGAIPTFKRHQVINNRESESEIPEPTEESLIEHGDIDACATREERVTDAKATRLVQDQGEGKGREGVCTRHDAFEKFWDMYPKKKSKGDAEKAWSKIKPNEQLTATIITAVLRAKTSVDWRKNNGEFIPYPASWLNARGWEDVLTVVVDNEKRLAI